MYGSFKEHTTERYSEQSFDIKNSPLIKINHK